MLQSYCWTVLCGALRVVPTFRFDSENAWRKKQPLERLERAWEKKTVPQSIHIHPRARVARAPLRSARHLARPRRVHTRARARDGRGGGGGNHLTHTHAQPQQGERCDVGSAKPRQWAREAAKEGSGSGVVSAGAGRGRRRRSGCGRTAGASGTARARCDRARRRCRGRAGHRRAPTLQVALCRERRRRASDARRRIRRRHRRHMPANCTALRADGAFVHAPQQTTVKGKGGERIH